MTGPIRLTEILDLEDMIKANDARNNALRQAPPSDQAQGDGSATALTVGLIAAAALVGVLFLVRR